MKHLRPILLLLCVTFLAATLAIGQKASDKKSYTFHGKVEAVDKAAKKLNVNNERIEGWMESMTMLYAVDDVSVLDKLKPGDLITATVYDGDYSLHNIQLVPKDATPAKK